MKFKLVEIDRAYELYKALSKKLNDLSPKITTIDNFRFEELYSYQIVDNYRLDRILKTIPEKERKRRTISVPVTGRESGYNNLEFYDSSYPLYVAGFLSEGFRRARYSVLPQHNYNLTELFEIRISSLIPGIVYLLTNNKFDQNKFNMNYSKSELEDLYELLQCLVSKTISESEEIKLIEYLNRDEIIKEFLYKSCILPGYKRDYYYTPAIIGNYFDGTITFIKKPLDIFLAYVKNYMLPIQLLYLEEIHNFVNDKPLLKVFVRSLQDYRIIVEKDLGCEFDLEIEFRNNMVLKPRIIIIKNYKDILQHRDFNMSKYLLKLEEIYGKDVYKNFMGEVDYRFKYREDQLTLNSE